MMWHSVSVNVDKTFFIDFPHSLLLVFLVYPKCYRLDYVILMKIIIVGATGTIGKEVVKVLEGRHEIVKVAHSGGDFKVDIGSTDSIEQLFNDIGFRE